MNITYLIGAGASYHALPIVEKIPERLGAFSEQFKMSDFEYVVSNDSDGNIALRYLKKVYVQDPKYADDIIEKIKGLIRGNEEEFVTKDTREIHFIPKTFVDQFFIPIEF